MMHSNAVFFLVFTCNTRIKASLMPASECPDQFLSCGCDIKLLHHSNMNQRHTETCACCSPPLEGNLYVFLCAWRKHYAQPALKELMNLRGKWDHVGLGEITIMQLLFHIFVHSKLWHQEEICAHLDYIFKWFFCLFVYKSCILAWAENFLKYINKSLFTVRDSQWIFLTNSDPRGFPVFMLCEAFFFFFFLVTSSREFLENPRAWSGIRDALWRVIGSDCLRGVAPDAWTGG